MKKPSKRSRKSERGHIRIGTSGWSYAHWRRVFYPEGLPSRRWLSYYSRYFHTVEVNNSFYNLPSESTIIKWRREAPNGFVFAVKANRFITHMKKLKSVDDSLKAFLERISRFGRSLGPVLFQLPPNLTFDAARFRSFLALLPARRRYVVEFRNKSWLNDQTLALLAKRRVAFCIHDMFEDPCPEHVTASFAYFRFHGFNERYGGAYSKKILKRYAETMAGLADSGKDVYAYFNNDAFGHALRDAVSLRKIVSKLIST